MIFLQVDLGDLYCGGTIIDADHVITAAHCLVDRHINVEGSTIAVGNKYPIRKYPIRKPKEECGKQVLCFRFILSGEGGAGLRPL